MKITSPSFGAIFSKLGAKDLLHFVMHHSSIVFSAIGRSNMHGLNHAIEKLKTTGAIHLEDLKLLKFHELESFAEQVQHWCVYGNSAPEKLGNCMGAQAKSHGGGNLESN